MNRYNIEVVKGAIFWTGIVHGYNGMDFIPSKRFKRLTEHAAGNAATMWCKKYDKKLNRQRKKYTYIP